MGAATIFCWKYRGIFGSHFLCWLSGVVPFNTWLISSWDECNCFTSWATDSKWSKLSFWVKIVVILSVAQLATAVIFFSAWDKSCDKRDNSLNSTQKTRILIYFGKSWCATKKNITWKCQKKICYLLCWLLYGKSSHSKRDLFEELWF